MKSMAEFAQGEIKHMETLATMFLDENNAIPDHDKVIVRDSFFAGGKKVYPVSSWPPAEFLACKRKSELTNFRLAKIQWGAGDKYIESIKFTMSNGDESPKYGKRAISDMCDVDNRIEKVTMLSHHGRLIGLVFEDAAGEFLRI